MYIVNNCVWIIWQIKNAPITRRSKLWRRRRDLNPWYGVAVYTISSRAHSTALPRLRRRTLYRFLFLLQGFILTLRATDVKLPTWKHLTNRFMTLLRESRMAALQHLDRLHAWLAARAWRALLATHQITRRHGICRGTVSCSRTVRCAVQDFLNSSTRL